MNLSRFHTVLRKANQVRELTLKNLPKAGYSSNQKPGNNNINLEKKETEFTKKSNIDVDKISLNSENILKRKNLERNRELNLPGYQIKKPSQHYDPKTAPNPSKDIFNFHDEALLQKNELMQIYGLANGYFTVNDVWYPGSIIAFPRQIFLWDVQTAADIRPHSFDILDVIKPLPSKYGEFDSTKDYIILGTGKDRYPLEDSIIKKFRDRGLKIDIIPTFEACSTFNVCNEDGLNIAAFLIPANL